MCSVIKKQREVAFERYDFYEMHSFPHCSTDCSAPSEPEGNEVLHQDRPVEDFAHQEMEATLRRKLQEADRRAEEIEKTAYEKGYAQGQKDGFDYGMKSASIVKEQLEVLFAGLRALPGEIHRDYRDWFVSTALAVARKIIDREISMDPGILIGMMESLLQEAEADQNMVIRVNPKDFELLKNNLEFERWLTNSGETFSVKPDAALQTGSCRFESDIQLIDDSVKSQLEMIGEHFNAIMQETEGGSP